MVQAQLRLGSAKMNQTNSTRLKGAVILILHVQSQSVTAVVATWCSLSCSFPFSSQCEHNS